MFDKDFYKWSEDHEEYKNDCWYGDVIDSYNESKEY